MKKKERIKTIRYMLKKEIKQKMKIKLRKLYYSNEIAKNPGIYYKVNANTLKEAKEQIEHIRKEIGIIPNIIYVGYEVISE